VKLDKRPPLGSDDCGHHDAKHCPLALPEPCAWHVAHNLLGERDEARATIDDLQTEIERLLESGDGYIAERNELRARVAEMEEQQECFSLGLQHKDTRIAGLEGALRRARMLLDLRDTPHNLEQLKKIDAALDGEGGQAEFNTDAPLPDCPPRELFWTKTVGDHWSVLLSPPACRSLRYVLDDEGGQSETESPAVEVRWFWANAERAGYDLDTPCMCPAHDTLRRCLKCLGSIRPIANAALDGADGQSDEPLPVSGVTREEVDRLLVEGQEGRRELHEQLDGMRPTAETTQMRLREAARAAGAMVLPTGSFSMSEYEVQSTIADTMRETATEEHAAAERRRAKRGPYTGDTCSNCGRIRVMRGDDGKRRCEKCGGSGRERAERLQAEVGRLREDREDLAQILHDAGRQILLLMQRVPDEGPPPEIIPGLLGRLESAISALKDLDQPPILPVDADPGIGGKEDEGG